MCHVDFLPGSTVMVLKIISPSADVSNKPAVSAVQNDEEQADSWEQLFPKPHQWTTQISLPSINL